MTGRVTNSFDYIPIPRWTPPWSTNPEEEEGEKIKERSGKVER